MLKTLAFIAVLLMHCAHACADVHDLLGTWRVDLRPTPESNPYYQTLVVTEITDSTLTGTFYGSEIRDGRVNASWGRPEIAFVTEDGSGVYHTSAVLRDGRLEGRTHSIGRGFLMPWRAIPVYDFVALSPEQAREDMELLQRALESIHPGLYRYADKKTIDGLFAELQEEFASGGTDLDLYREVSLVVAAIRCGHSRVEAPRAYDEYRAQVPTHLPFHFRFLEGRMIVTTARPPAHALTRGTEILSINGVSTTELIEQIGPTVIVDGMTDHIRPSRLETAYEFSDSGLDHYLPLFHGIRDDFTLDCRSPAGETFRETVRAITRPEWAGLESGGPDNFADSVTVVMIDDHTALLRIDSFINYRNSVEPEQVYRPIFQSLNDDQVEHLVIDLRANGGGSADASWSLARFLIDAPVRSKAPLVKNYRFDDELKRHLSTWAEGALDMPDDAFRKRDDGWYELLPWASGRAIELTPDPDRYTGRVTVLVGPYNASGTTMLLATLKEADRVRLVGLPTGGSAEGPTAGVLFTLRLPHSGITVNIPALWERSPVESFESGLGVSPDETVPVTIDDFLSDRDPALEAAIRVPQ